MAERLNRSTNRKFYNTTNIFMMEREKTHRRTESEREAKRREAVEVTDKKSERYRYKYINMKKISRRRYKYDEEIKKNQGQEERK